MYVIKKRKYIVEVPSELNEQLRHKIFKILNLVETMSFCGR